MNGGVPHNLTLAGDLIVAEVGILYSFCILVTMFFVAHMLANCVDQICYSLNVCK